MDHIKPLPTVEYLRAYFEYNPKTGELKRKRRPRSHFASTNSWSVWNARFAGTLAGTLYKDSYYRVRVNYTEYLVHRVIWKIVTGKEPPPTVDHRDGDGFNNRWKNLRPATQQEQLWNTRRKSDNTSGYKGVNLHRSKWRAAITINHKHHHIGYFPTAKQASIAYEVAARKLHGKFYKQTHTKENQLEAVTDHQRTRHDA